MSTKNLLAALALLLAACGGGSGDGMFLEERVNDRPSMDLLRGQDWSFVILQAQKYSSSGQFVYSTEEAQELVRMSRVQHAVPIMFPEWPRRDVVSGRCVLTMAAHIYM